VTVTPNLTPEREVGLVVRANASVWIWSDTSSPWSKRLCGQHPAESKQRERRQAILRMMELGEKHHLSLGGSDYARFPACLAPCIAHRRSSCLYGRPAQKSGARRGDNRARLSAPSGHPSTSAKHAKQFRKRIEEPIHHALLKRNDRVVGNRNTLRANLSAALGDIA
jgi:hypothetical protein